MFENFSSQERAMGKYPIQTIKSILLVETYRHIWRVTSIYRKKDCQHEYVRIHLYSTAMLFPGSHLNLELHTGFFTFPWNFHSTLRLLSLTFLLQTFFDTTTDVYLFAFICLVNNILCFLKQFYYLSNLNICCNC